MNIILPIKGENVAFTEREVIILKNEICIALSETKVKCKEKQKTESIPLKEG